MRPPDPAFADPRLAVLYDVLDHDRSDLDAYVGIVEEIGARSVVDVGCGTGSLAVRLAALGLHVVGVDPAAASLDVARGKAYADRVTWVHGDATALAPAPVSDLGLDSAADLAVMTGNVAQVFVADSDWARTLDAVRRCLRPGGWFVFESRRPQVRDWERWSSAATGLELPDGRTLTTSQTVTEVALPLVTFESVVVLDGRRLESRSTLRFRDRDEFERDLTAHGFQVVELRDAPDRPGKEYVVLARRTARPA